MTGRIAAVMTETKVKICRKGEKRKEKNKYNVSWEVGGSREVK